MSWLARSLANSLRLDDDDANVAQSDFAPRHPLDLEQRYRLDEEEEEGEEIETENQLLEDDQSNGVKKDLTELKQTLTRQIWGVASFLAPPPPPPPSVHRDEFTSSSDRFEPSDPSVCGEREEERALLDPVGFSGIRSDFREIGGRFREMSKMASNYFPFGAEEDGVRNEEYYEEEREDNLEANAVGITDEVLAFARNIAMHPETWLDFPLDEEEDLDDFEMSDAQHDHALVVERLAPRLAALRRELCPCHMTESYFWKVYFVLLHSRLNRQDAVSLSSSQVIAARASWMKELQKQTQSASGWLRESNYQSKNNSALRDEDFKDVVESTRYGFEHMPSTSISMREYEMDKHTVVSTDMPFIDKSVTEEKVVTRNENKVIFPDSEEDEWPDEGSEPGAYSGTVISVGNEDDVSFSDLEDIDDYSTPIKSTIVSKHTEARKT